MSHYGLHWEWRGFGRLSEGLRAQIEALKPKFPEPDRVTDEYLWAPGCELNVKLRSKGSGSLKFKRRHRTDRALQAELWLEDAREEYSFPIAPPAVRALADALGLKLPEGEHPMARTEVLPALAAAGVRAVTVQKVRRQYDTMQDGVRIIIELAQVLSPERVDSVAIESEADLTDESTHAEVQRAGCAVARARELLGAATTLQQLSYLEALEIWATGGRLDDGAGRAGDVTARLDAPPQVA